MTKKEQGRKEVRDLRLVIRQGGAPFPVSRRQQHLKKQHVSLLRQWEHRRALSSANAINTQAYFVHHDLVLANQTKHNQLEAIRAQRERNVGGASADP